jgi:hypothetical protein
MSTALVSANADLNAKIAEFVKAADEVTAEYWEAQKFTFSPPPRHRADFLSDKWVRVVTLEQRGEEWKVASVYAFIALVDNSTKALGNVKAGDVHKAASFKAPAKHARANVFDDDFRKALTSHGIVYLRH